MTYDPQQLSEIQTQLNKIEGYVKQINGSVKRHDEEIFGDSNRGTPGLVKDVQIIKDTILTAKAVIRTLWVIAGFLGLTNIAAIVALTNGGG